MAWTNLLGQVRVGIRGSVSQNQTQSLLLDTYSGAVVAYSLRKINSTYTGSAIRVRRSSDNTEQNIGFNADGTLNTLSLLAFVGSGNGFVTTWYDQSANSRNAYQTTAAYQPFIVNAGSIVTNGGKPAIRNTSNGGFFIDNVSIGATNSMYALIDFGASAREYFGTFGNSWAFYQPNGEYKASGSAAGSTNAAFSLNRFIGSLQRYSGKMQYYSNSNPHGSEITLSGSPTAPFILGNLIGEGYGYGFIGDQQEAIVYDKDMRNSRASIESNINSYYGIYATDTDAQSFINAASITDGTQIRAIDTLVTSLKSAGIWTKMKAIYPFVGGSATSHKFNLKDPRDLDAAYRLTFSGGMTHSSTGVLFGGVNGYANTKFIMNQVYTSSVTNIHVSYYSRTNSTSDIMIGMQDDSVGQGSQIYLSDSGTSQTYSALNTDNNWVRSNNSSPSVGFYLVSRTSMNLLKGYKNGVSVGSNTTTSNSSNLKSGLPLLLGAQIYKYTSTSYWYGNKETAFATIGDGLTDAEATAFYNAVQAYQTALGRAV